jgi:hypothetical protein
MEIRLRSELGTSRIQASNFIPAPVCFVLYTIVYLQPYQKTMDGKREYLILFVLCIIFNVLQCSAMHFCIASVVIASWRILNTEFVAISYQSFLIPRYYLTYIIRMTYCDRKEIYLRDFDGVTCISPLLNTRKCFWNPSGCMCACANWKRLSGWTIFVYIWHLKVGVRWTWTFYLQKQGPFT